MKIKQDKKFSPIIIVIETEKELAEFYLPLNNESRKFSKLFCKQVTDYLYSNNIMSDKKAKGILK